MFGYCCCCCWGFGAPANKIVNFKPCTCLDIVVVVVGGFLGRLPIR